MYLYVRRYTRDGLSINMLTLKSFYYLYRILCIVRFIIELNLVCKEKESDGKKCLVDDYEMLLKIEDQEEWWLLLLVDYGII